MYRIIDTVPIKKAKHRKVVKFARKWLESENNVRIIRYNKKLGVAEGKGFFEYYNKIVMEDVFLSPRVAERTNGTISYRIRVIHSDSVVYVQYYNFEHIAYNSQYGPISFGLLSFFDMPPPGTCQEAAVWCKAVYADMKKLSTEEQAKKQEKLFPNSFIRKKAYRVKEEEEEEEIAEDIDPLDYLKLEHYIKKYEELEGVEPSEGNATKENKTETAKKANKKKDKKKKEKKTKSKKEKHKKEKQPESDTAEED